MARWTAADLPDLSGRTVLVTGANSGLGLESASALAAKGARVLMACRDRQRGTAAVDDVNRMARDGGKAELVGLDLADLASVRSAAEEVRASTNDALDVLLNNAGVMATPRRATRDGFELQLGTNHLGHAALTWLLMPALRARPAARVVTVSSILHKLGGLDASDLNYERRRYRSWGAYGQSKLANLLFAFELDRRARAAGLDVLSVAAHPGLSDTDLVANMMRTRGAAKFASPASSMVGLFGQPPRQAVLPLLYAATAPDVAGGQFWGPGGFQQMRGFPKLVKADRRARDERTAARVWDLTAELTKVTPDPA